MVLCMGKAIQSCTACRVLMPAGVCSVWLMPWWSPVPAVIRLTCLGRMVWRLPRLSWCNNSPSSIQVKVCRLVCGCAPICKPSSCAAKCAGPAWSRKHHAPMVRCARLGSSRAIGMPPTSWVFAVILVMVMGFLSGAGCHRSESLIQLTDVRARGTVIGLNL